MKTIEAEKLNEIGELLEVLSVDAGFIQGTIDKLELLRELVIKRDDKGLANLMEQIKSESRVYSQNVKKRLELRGKVAVMLGWPAEDVRLSKLEPVLPEDMKQRVFELRQNLQELSVRIKSEISGTSMMLRELARFNSMVLNAILGGNKNPEITYSSSGIKNQKRSSGLVNMRL
jgi:hypothetical protein